VIINTEEPENAGSGKSNVCWDTHQEEYLAFSPPNSRTFP